MREKRRHEPIGTEGRHYKKTTLKPSRPHGRNQRSISIEYYRAYRTGTGLEAVGVVEGVRIDRGIGIEGEVADGTRYMSCCVLAPTFDCWLVRACAAGKRRELEAETIAMVIYPTNNY